MLFASLKKSTTAFQKCCKLLATQAHTKLPRTQINIYAHSVCVNTIVWRPVTMSALQSPSELIDLTDNTACNIEYDNNSQAEQNTKSSKLNPENKEQNINVNHGSKQLFDVLSIGTVQSCYRLKYGTQRQGCNVCSTSRGILELHSHIDIHVLDGLSEYSHIWILYIFNDNGNKTFHSTVHPPRLDGEKLGVYATRSPHRINPIGQTLVKLDKIVGRKLYISGLDLIDDTPVIDIKPVHPAEQLTQYTVPDWTLPDNKLLNVEFTDQAIELLHQYAHQLQFYNDFAEIQSALSDVLCLDARPYWHKEADDVLKPILFDRLLIHYKIANNVCTVTNVELLSDKQIDILKQQEAVAFNKPTALINDATVT